MFKIKSKKFWVFVVSAVLFLANGLAGNLVDPDTVSKVLALVASYLLGQGIADHGWQGAVNGARRAAREGEDMVRAVMGVLHDEVQGSGQGTPVRELTEDAEEVVSDGQ